MKVIGVRGTNGSGKSWVARKIMERADDDFIKKHKLSNGVLINVYKSFVVIGSYDNQCGGCDGVKTPALVWDTVVECAQHSNVLFEGVIVGNVYEPTILLVERLKEIGAEYIPLCLNTDFDQCVANINNRRAEAGKEPMEKTENVTINDKKNKSSARKLKEAGLNPYWVSSEEAAQIALRELGYD